MFFLVHIYINLLYASMMFFVVCFVNLFLFVYFLVDYNNLTSFIISLSGIGILRAFHDFKIEV
jgi:hypothetical protein